MKNARTSELQLVYSRGTWRRRHTEHYFVKFNNSSYCKNGVNGLNAVSLRVASNYLAVLPGSHNDYKNT